MMIGTMQLADALSDREDSDAVLDNGNRSAAAMLAGEPVTDSGGQDAGGSIDVGAEGR
jgi:hypothetical protein